MAESSEAVLEVPMEDIDPGTRAELEYAGFWSRVAALIVDDAILIVLGLALLIAAGFVGAEAVVIANFVFMLVAFFYWPVLESTDRQATLGKQLLGIQVTDTNGARLSFVRALLRNLAKILSSLPFGLGFLLAAFTPKRQALHDMITKCLVVRAGPSNLRKAVIYVVGALVVSIAGGYYYFTEVYLPQMMQDVDQQMKQAQKGMPASKPAPGQAPVAKVPAPTPATPPAPTAAGEAKPMTPQEIAEFEKKLAEAKPEPAKGAAAPPAKEAAPKPAAAPAKPEATPAAKEPPAKVAAAPAAKPKPKTKPAAVAVVKPRPVPAPPLVALVTEPPAPPPASPAEPRAPAPPAAAPVVAPVAVAPPSRPARSPRFNDVMTAVMFRDAAALSELLELGWWVDRRDSNGLTPLMAAAWNGDAALAQILLKAGADPNAHARGGSVLDYAGRGEDARVIELLKSSGAR